MIDIHITHIIPKLNHMQLQNKINTAAITLHKEFGTNFTLDQLVQSTNTSRATLYRRIGNKDELLKKLADQGLIQLNNQADAKSRILAATRIVVSKHGFINCTMDQIATESGLGIATLYRHFTEKENLLRAFTKEIKSEVAIEKFNLAADSSVEDGVIILAKTMLKFIDDNKDIVKILFFGNPEERKYITEIRDASSSTFKQIAKHLHTLQAKNQLSPDIKIDDMVASLMGLLLQFALTAPLNLNRKLNIEADAKLITTIFCNGLLASDKEQI